MSDSDEDYYPPEYEYKYPSSDDEQPLISPPHYRFILNDYDEDLLHAFADDMELFQHLIKNNANINSIDQFAQSFLHMAVYKCDINLIKYLIQNGININIRDDHGYTPLHIATLICNKQLINYLLNNNANIDIQDINGETPLFWAIKSNKSIDLIEFLISKGADINIQNINQETALSWLINTNNDIHLINFLIQHGAYLDLDIISNTLYANLINNDINTIILLIQSKLNKQKLSSLIFVYLSKALLQHKFSKIDSTTFCLLFNNLLSNNYIDRTNFITYMRILKLVYTTLEKYDKELEFIYCIWFNMFYYLYPEAQYTFVIFLESNNTKRQYNEIISYFYQSNF